MLLQRAHQRLLHREVVDPALVRRVHRLSAWESGLNPSAWMRFRRYTSRMACLRFSKLILKLNTIVVLEYICALEICTNAIVFESGMDFYGEK